MQHSPLANITRILLWVLIGGMIMVWVAYAAAAIGSTLGGWRTAWVVEDITDNTGTCRRITAWPANYFIPSRTATEYNAFTAVAASKGFTITSCGIPVVNWVCGGGANTCSVGSPSGYSAGACGGSQTWSCLGSGGGTNASCSIANAACVVHNYTWRTWYFEPCDQVLAGYSRRAFYCQDDINHNNTGPSVANSLCVGIHWQPGYNQWFVQCIGVNPQPNNWSFFFGWMPIINL